MADDSEELLFTKLDGEKADLQHVIWDGLDVDYSSRFPALERLMLTGEPRHRFYACAMLTSWGVASGIEMLTKWATRPEDVPWTLAKVPDDSFEDLADALRVAEDAPGRDAAFDELRAAAARALLGSFHVVYTGRKMYELLDDAKLRPMVAADIEAAAERALAALDEGKGSFDLAKQTASLLAALAPVDDAHAASVAETLVAKHARMLHTLNEIAWSLRFGTGPGTRAVLERLVESPHPSVAQLARESLSTRR